MPTQSTLWADGLWAQGLWAPGLWQELAAPAGDEAIPFVAADEAQSEDDTLSDDELLHIAAALITTGVLEQCH